MRLFIVLIQNKRKYFSSFKKMVFQRQLPWIEFWIFPYFSFIAILVSLYYDDNSILVELMIHEERKLEILRSSKGDLCSSNESRRISNMLKKLKHTH